MLIAVGSENPVKIAAVRAVTLRVWPQAGVQGVAVSSGVRLMPQNDVECITGARARARAALQALDAHLALGLEGGIQELEGDLLLTGWVAAVDRQGRRGLGSAARLLLPSIVTQQLKSGRELGPVMDQLTGREHTNHAEGAIGILTGKLMTRQRSFEAGVAYALAPWLSPNWYVDEETSSLRDRLETGS